MRGGGEEGKDGGKGKEGGEGEEGGNGRRLWERGREL